MNKTANQSGSERLLRDRARMWMSFHMDCSGNKYLQREMII